MKLSIIIPAYNEQESIDKILLKLLGVDFSHYVNGRELIIVDDCSTDNTYEILERFVATHEQEEIKLLRHDVNQGKGAAVKTGIDVSSGDLITIQDADLELNPNDIVAMLKARADLGVNFVNGSRYIPGKIRPLYAYRRYFFNKAFTYLASLLVNVRFTDIACGYKLFSSKMYGKIQLKEKRFGFEAELLLKVSRLDKTTIAEVPVDYFPRNKGGGKKIRNTDGLRIFWVIIKYGLLKVK